MDSIKMFLLIKRKAHKRGMRNFELKSEVLQDKSLITQTIKMRNIWKSNSIEMMVYLKENARTL